MRIVIHSTTGLGRRIARVVLADRALTALGILGEGATPTGDVAGADRRVTTVDDLARWDAVVSDSATPPHSVVTDAVLAGVPIVTAANDDDRVGRAADGAASPVVAGANLARGLGAVLAAHLCAEFGMVDSATVAWTEPGSSRSRRESVLFPPPVGAQWTEPAAPAWEEAPPGTTFRRARIEGEWAACLATVQGTRNGEGTRLELGVADYGPYLEAIVLAAAVLIAADGGYTSGRVAHLPDEAARFLDVAGGAGLEVATPV